MKAQTLSLASTRQFSSLFLAYLQQEKNLTPFYGQYPQPGNFRQQMAEKQFSAEKRELLQAVLQEQYAEFELPQQAQQNMAALSQENTFTITTGHQLNIFTGPLYFIYKIATVIKACQELQQQYPDKQFVPVYWMATEDHDLAEINHFNLFGKTYTWETNQEGPVGRMNTDGLAELAKELPEAVPVFEEAYQEGKTLAEATLRYVHRLFGQYGLLVLDADNSRLKESFVPLMKEELLEQKSLALVQKASQQLEELGYKSQIYPREINLFYIKDGLRERIVQEGEEWQVLNTDLRFGKEALLKELKEYPERFSPNVVLRPLYEEWIMPNLAYVGGPAEVVYWLQLKPLFDHYEVAFPMLMPRQFALVLNKTSESRREKLGLSVEELFEDPHEMKARLVREWSEHEIHLEEEKKELQQLFEQLQQKAITVDKSLEGFVGAEGAKAAKSLENIEKRLKKAEEQRHSTELNQLESLLDKLFPNGGLQERSENFLNFYLNDPEFIEKLLEHLQPFRYAFNVLSYEDES